jgi:hypothetical protein
VKEAMPSSESPVESTGNVVAIAVNIISLASTLSNLGTQLLHAAIQAQSVAPQPEPESEPSPPRRFGKP